MFWILTASGAFGVGGAFMKSSSGFERMLPGIVALLCFLVGAALLTMAVRAEGLSTAYTIGLGIEAVLSVFMGRWLYQESLAAPQMLGVAMILGGVAAVRVG
jgi:small multidrug resistance pump